MKLIAIENIQCKPQSLIDLCQKHAFKTMTDLLSESDAFNSAIDKLQNEEKVLKEQNKAIDGLSFSKYPQYSSLIDSFISKAKTNRADAATDFYNANQKLEKFNNAVNPLIEAISAYQAFLTTEVKKNAGTQMHTKANTRLTAVNELLADLESPIINQGITDVLEKTTSLLDVIAKNQPTWAEKPFIQKLVDILTLGILPLMRYFEVNAESQEVDKINSWVEQKNNAQAKGYSLL